MNGAREDGAQAKKGLQGAGERTLDKHWSRRQAPAFWEPVGFTFDDRRAHSLESYNITDPLTLP